MKDKMRRKLLLTLITLFFAGGFILAPPTEITIDVSSCQFIFWLIIILTQYYKETTELKITIKEL